MRVETALGIGVDIKLNLAHAAVDLLCQRLVLIVETFVGVGVLRLPEFRFTRRDARVIAVVRSDHLNLIDLQRCAVWGLREACCAKECRTHNCRPKGLCSHQRLPLCLRMCVARSCGTACCRGLT